MFDAARAGVRADRSQFFKDLSVTLYGADRAGANVPGGLRNGFWFQGMHGGIRNLVECVAAFSATDQTADLRAFDVPTLILHGDADRIVLLDLSGRRAAGLIPDARLKVYPGASHGLCTTHKEQVNADLLAFLES